MKITPENTIRLFDHTVTVGAIEQVLNTLRKHGSVYIEIHDQSHTEYVPTLAEVLYK